MDKVMKSLKRAEGQAEAVVKMYEEDKPCLDVIQQITATRAALGSVAREMLKKEVTKCMVDEQEKDKLDKILKQLFKS